MALTRKAIPSPNYSSRGGASVRLIVLHTAEGARTIEELGNFFKNPASQVSSHVGADDTPNTVAEYVRREQKAWTAANANPVAVQIELCAFADWSVAEWQRHPAMLANCSAWIAEEAAFFGIPITKLTPQQAQSGARGVCQHKDLGAWGGNHYDCGLNFPVDRVLSVARDEQGGTEMGYPDWYWQWSSWYLTTKRDPAKRPASAPQTIPAWAWDANEKQLKLLDRYGMTGGERDWIAWYLDGKTGVRPSVPTTIPDRWWDDERWALDRES